MFGVWLTTSLLVLNTDWLLNALPGIGRVKEKTLNAVRTSINNIRVTVPDLSRNSLSFLCTSIYLFSLPSACLFTFRFPSASPSLFLFHTSTHPSLSACLSFSSQMCKYRIRYGHQYGNKDWSIMYINWSGVIFFKLLCWCFLNSASVFILLVEETFYPGNTI